MSIRTARRKLVSGRQAAQAQRLIDHEIAWPMSGNVDGGGAREYRRTRFHAISACMYFADEIWLKVFIDARCMFKNF
ncbi:hypothetical protein [Xylophilus sp. GOD-11R]|uniref:hypothetical protein n=1 Tax=Xylophilus sp. GOD-11R TaxID=3089814 RepID=UPI00298C7609|nr:hypothetical protein [Xylophilus sp. GOD-11R]WPB58106.1 hypothetical protein R9X41_05555 [Xylophilus sp. GOD-11R]